MAMIPSGFKGKIYMLWNVECEFLYFSDYPDLTGYSLLGEIDVDVNFSTADASAQAVAMIDKQIEAVRAESHAKITGLENKRQSYLALPAGGGK